MSAIDPVKVFDLFVVHRFLDDNTCQRMMAELRTAPVKAAVVYGQGESGTVDARVRKTLRLAPSTETRDYVVQRLWECKKRIEQHFNIPLTECEEPQFLRYREGDFFVAHQDGNTGLLRLDTEARRVSIVISLNQQSGTRAQNSYQGGSLVFHDWRGGKGSGALAAVREPGTLVAFRSETTHEVEPVTDGERFSIAGWYR